MNWALVGYVALGVSSIIIVAVCVLIISYACEVIMTLRMNNNVSDVACYLSNIRYSLGTGHSREQSLLWIIEDELLNSGGVYNEDDVVERFKESLKVCDAES